ncbi:MAG TPA: sodium:proton antiporter NhaD [Longimicrobiales bacterium]|nr:sodium:proton antiporter NhaD [Longimicrobiales bacterium]
MNIPILASFLAPSLDLTRHWAGIISLVVFVIAYLLVMGEEKLQLRKSKPVIMAAGIIWMLVGFAYMRAGDTSATDRLHASVTEFAELFLFVLVAMTFVNVMEERRLFDALRAWLVRKQLSLRAIFWLTGAMSFFLSSQLDNLTTALVMGTVVVTVGRGYPKFIAMACINVVIAANAGGAWSPFGDITTLMVWQEGKVGFFQFYALIIPSLVNWLIPAACMHFALPKAKPEADGGVVVTQRGAWGVVALFALTIALAVSSFNLLKLPPFIGMTTGLGLLKFYGYYLKRTHRSVPIPVEPALGARLRRPVPTAVGAASISPRVEAPPPLPTQIGDEEDVFDIFAILRKAEWDTLLFFYGIILCVGGLANIGYLTQLSHFLYNGFGATTANVAVGVLSAMIDNIPVMFAVLNMEPVMELKQWLLVTLTAGVGGSLLSVGSAAGVGLMGQSRGQYTFLSHLKWTWAIALGYAASIWVHMLIN